MSRRRQQRFHQTQNFYKSLQLLQAGKLLREGADGSAEGGGGVAEDGTPFEDYSIFLYRQQAPIFNDRVKELERKLLFPVSNQDRLDRFLKKNCLAARCDFVSFISFVVNSFLSTPNYVNWLTLDLTRSPTTNRVALANQKMMKTLCFNKHDKDSYSRVQKHNNKADAILIYNKLVTKRFS